MKFKQYFLVRDKQKEVTMSRNPIPVNTAGFSFADKIDYKHVDDFCQACLPGYLMLLGIFGASGAGTGALLSTIDPDDSILLYTEERPT